MSVAFENSYGERTKPYSGGEGREVDRREAETHPWPDAGKNPWDWPEGEPGDTPGQPGMS